MTDIPVTKSVQQWNQSSDRICQAMETIQQQNLSSNRDYPATGQWRFWRRNKLLGDRGTNLETFGEDRSAVNFQRNMFDGSSSRNQLSSANMDRTAAGGLQTALNIVGRLPTALAAFTAALRLGTVTPAGRCSAVRLSQKFRRDSLLSNTGRC